MRSTPVYAWTEFCIYKLILFTDENKIILRLTFTCNMILGFTNFSTFLSFGLENLIFRHCETFSFDDGWWVTNSMSECQQKCEKNHRKIPLSAHIVKKRTHRSKELKIQTFSSKNKKWFRRGNNIFIISIFEATFSFKIFLYVFSYHWFNICTRRKESEMSGEDEKLFSCFHRHRIVIASKEQVIDTHR